MSTAIAQAERQQKIHRVIDYIFSHLDQEITMQTLGKVAHYSPFHLQKLFKELVGESPKQFTLKLRLETASHLLIIHPHKSIQEIALDGGFSSPAVFSRAMKNYFGYSPEQLRQLPHNAKMKLLHGDRPEHQTPLSNRQTSLTPVFGHPTIQIVRKESIKGIYQLASFNEPEKIRRAFQSLARFATTHDLSTNQVFGILSPFQRNIYKAFLPLPKGTPITSPFPLCEIKGGTFATFTVLGKLEQTSKTAHYFIHRWLPGSGFKIASVAGFETFAGNPASIPYNQLQRQIHIPVEPVL